MVQKLLDFIQNSPDCYHAVDSIRNCLTENGYRQISFADWSVQPGGKYFTVRNESSVIVFRIPAEQTNGFVLAAAHTDSPCLRIRSKAELEGEYIRLETERYGGMIESTWLDRPLSAAGRVMVRSEAGLRSCHVNLAEPVALIPNVAPHISRGAQFDPARDMMALFGERAAKGGFLRLLATETGCKTDDIASFDLILYNNQPGCVWGTNGEFVSAPRLDDLACVYAGLEAFLTADSGGKIPVFCAFHNEEIGSETRQGAASDFLPEVLRAITESLGKSNAEHRAMLQSSLMLSCDNGHALHPNRPELSDKNEAPVLNGGVVIKHSPRYATDAISAAIFSEICGRTGVAVQHYSNRPDIEGGSTLGNIANTDTPACMVDIGLAQLAMHSSFETMGARDIAGMVKAIKACYEAKLSIIDGSVTL